MDPNIRPYERSGKTVEEVIKDLEEIDRYLQDNLG